MAVLHTELDALFSQEVANFIDLAHEKVAELGEVLAPWLTLREYQLDALGREVYYFEKSKRRPPQVHLMFNAATGAGKTALMAWNIGYLYSKGYCNFIFLVNSTTIVDKTRANFLDETSRKYLFHPAKNFKLQEVATFPLQGTPGTAYIKFCTVAGLCSEMLVPRENGFDAEQVRTQKLVILGDEAHHFNAATKKAKALVDDFRTVKTRLSSVQDPDVDLNKAADKQVKTWEADSRSWEEAIGYLIGLNVENVLLEFTATLPQEPAVLAKYNDKLIFKYGLKEFRKAQFTKEIELVRVGADTEADRDDRVLCALLMSQYRRVLFSQPELKVNCAPVVLFKSQSIAENESNHAKFLQQISTLTVAKLQDLAAKYYGTDMGDLIGQAFSVAGGVEPMLSMVQRDFASDRVRVVDSSNKKEDLSFLSRLDDPSNGIRAIFAVKMLNEGWDVLSLFDIVRLYETRSNVVDKHTGKIKPGPQTVSEAQLIGRGARYFPFAMHQGQDPYVRKFDADTDNKLRLLETLVYYSSQDNHYITELKTALTAEGLWEEATQAVVQLKQDFVDYVESNQTSLRVNTVNTSTARTALSVLERKTLRVDFSTGGERVEVQFEESVSGAVVPDRVQVEKQFLKNFAPAVWLKAVNLTNQARLPVLTKLFTDVSSVQDLLTWLQGSHASVVQRIGDSLDQKNRWKW